ncbi:MAG: HNH endonuclease [Anaerolineales bacterium]|nr:HNH endonuclease [Anaerolineales bacterium]
MKTYLLTWNPKKWTWEHLEKNIAEIQHFGFSEFTWTTGVTKKIKDGDRVFVMGVGEVPKKGIVASGWATSDVKTRKRDGKNIVYIDGYFDTIRRSNEVFPIENLVNNEKYKKVYWTPQASGINIIDEVAKELEKDWAKFLNQPALHHEIKYADDIDISKKYYEGVLKQVKVNKFERSPGARAVCLNKHGAICSVCGFDFAKRYGEIGEGYIHVHHLKPLSEIRKGYKLNPVNDLRPVCPNCHAMIHQRKPKPYTIEEMKNILRKK